MQITTAILVTEQDKAAHSDGVTAALATQAALWAIAPGH